MTNKLQSMFSFSTVLGRSVHHIFITLVKWLTSWGSQSTGWFPVLKAQTHSDRLRILSLLFFLKTLSELWGLLFVCLCLPVPSCLSLSSISYTLHRSDQISRSVMSDSLRPHESQNARPPCPSPTPGVHSDSRPSSRWCHPAISSSVVPFSSCPPIPPSIRVFSNESTLRMRWPKYWSFSFSINPSKEIPGLIIHTQIHTYIKIYVWTCPKA